MEQLWNGKYRFTHIDFKPDDILIVDPCFYINQNGNKYDLWNSVNYFLEQFESFGCEFAGIKECTIVFTNIDTLNDHLSM
jgi:hypothetical protein